MEKELGLRQPMSRRMHRARIVAARPGRLTKVSGRYQNLNTIPVRAGMNRRVVAGSALPPPKPAARKSPIKKRKRDQNVPDSKKLPFHRPEWDTAELLAWAWANGRHDILAQFGIYFADDFEL